MSETNKSDKWYEQDKHKLHIIQGTSKIRNIHNKMISLSETGGSFPSMIISKNICNLKQCKHIGKIISI